MELDNALDLARWIVEYEFQSPQARYSTRQELIDAYATKIQALVDREVAAARKNAIKSMMSRINSQGFYGLMTGSYELKPSKDRSEDA